MRTDSNPEHIRQAAASVGAESLLIPEVLRNTRIAEYEAGETIMFSGDAVTAVSVLLRGSVRIYSVSENGKLVTVAVAKPPQMFGDIEFLKGHETLHSVVAETSTALLCFTLEDVRDHLSSQVAFYRLICNNLIEKLYNTSYNYSKVLLYDTKKLLAQQILENCDDTGVVRCKSKELAEHLGVTPRHISRLITELEKKGVVSRQYGRRLRVVDRQLLLRYVQNTE